MNNYISSNRKFVALNRVIHIYGLCLTSSVLYGEQYKGSAAHSIPLDSIEHCYVYAQQQ